MILGITGSFGSGKTTLSKMFEKYGFWIVDADKISHDILDRNKKVATKIAKEFGNIILDSNKKISREKLADIVFADDSALKKLNLIMHAFIIKEIKKKIAAIKKENKKLKKKDSRIIIDAPLLLETDSKHLVEKVVVVKTDFKVIESRALIRGVSKKRITQIILNQMPIEEKIKLADFVIDNSGSLEKSREQVGYVVNQLLHSADKLKD